MLDKIKNGFRIFFTSIYGYLAVNVIVFICVVAFFVYVDYTLQLDIGDMQRRDIVDIVVKADASLIAFTGVIATMILRHLLESEKTDEDLKIATLGGPTRIIESHYKVIRNNIISFTSVTLIMLVLGILSSLVTIFTKNYLDISISIGFLVSSVVSIVMMLRYALR